MSDYYYQLIPTIPDYVPDAVARERARARFASFVPNALEVTAEVSEQVEFVTCPEGFETISCPVCGTVLARGTTREDTWVDWWSTAMDAAYTTSRFADLRVTVPCCGAATSLNDLRYHFPQGFARFVLSAFEPQVSDLEEWQIRDLEDLVDCKLRKIWVRV
jgi:hypothetical protein